MVSRYILKEATLSSYGIHIHIEGGNTAQLVLGGNTAQLVFLKNMIEITKNKIKHETETKIPVLFFANWHRRNTFGKE